jgi:Fe-S cluster assembly scaffold protein SufB
LNPFNRDSIERLSTDKEEPTWMTALRLASWEAYERLTKDAPVSILEDVQAYAEPPRASVPSHEWPEDLKYVVEERGDEEGLIMQRDSTILSRSITKDQTKKGVIFTDLNMALRLYPELVQKYLARQVKWDDPFAALNTAFWSGGTFLYVPENVRIHLPFHTCYWMTTPHSAVFPRTLVMAERGSIVTLVDDFLSVDWNQETLAVSAVELSVQEKAIVSYTQIHHWGRGVRHENRQMSSVAASGRLESAQTSAARAKITLERAAELFPEVR